MKISEAIKIGMQGRTQCRGRYFDLYVKDVTEVKECCALGAAYIGWCVATRNPFRPFAMGSVFYKFDNLEDPDSVRELVKEIVIHWNDKDKLSFDEIIAKLEERGM